MHRAHVLGAALVSCILEKSGVSKVVIGAAAVALLAIGLLLVTAEPWKVQWGLALSGAHLAHFPGWDPQTSIFWSTWGLSMAPWPRPSARAASGWRAMASMAAATARPSPSAGPIAPNDTAMAADIFIKSCARAKAAARLIESGQRGKGKENV